MKKTHGAFHSHGGTPTAGWFRAENPIKVDDWGCSYFRKPPHVEKMWKNWKKHIMKLDLGAIQDVCFC